MRPREWWYALPPTAFAVGSVAGGAATGASLGVLGGLLPDLSSLLLFIAGIALVIVVMANDFAIVSWKLPGARRQVPQTVARRGVLGAWRFGFEMGTGLRTYLTAATPHILAFLMVATPIGVGDCILIGVAFGLSRGLVPFSRFGAENSDTWDERFQIGLASSLHAKIGAPAGLLALVTLVRGVATA